MKDKLLSSLQIKTVEFDAQFNRLRQITGKSYAEKRGEALKKKEKSLDQDINRLYYQISVKH